MSLFIAKLSVYANCVPRSQRFHCRIKTFLYLMPNRFLLGLGFIFLFGFQTQHSNLVSWSRRAGGLGGGGQGNQRGAPTQLPSATKPPKEASVKKFGFHRFTELCSWPVNTQHPPRPQGRYGPLLPLKAVVFGRFLLSKQSFIVI